MLSGYPNKCAYAYISICCFIIALFISTINYTPNTRNVYTNVYTNIRNVFKSNITNVHAKSNITRLHTQSDVTNVCTTSEANNTTVFTKPRIIDLKKKPNITNIHKSSNTNNSTLKKGTATNNKTKSILMWTEFFGSSNNFFNNNGSLKRKLVNCPQKCIFSRERNKPTDFDALIFHTRDAQKPPKDRHSNQVYIAWTLESPINRRNGFIKGGNFYNWTMTYARSSTILFGYGMVLKRPAKIQVGDLPQLKVPSTNGSVILTSLASNCGAPSNRDGYINKLKTFMPVDSYGRCGKPCPTGKTGDCYFDLAATGKYKFHLAFENSICKDYVTEKPFKALQAGLVPVVLGGMALDDYFSLPPKSYIDARNFKTVKDLANHLQELNRNNTKYLEYHAWRTQYEVGFTFQVNSGHACKVCKALHNATLMKSTQNIDFGKYWDPSTLCDNTYVNKILG